MRQTYYNISTLYSLKIASSHSVFSQDLKVNLSNTQQPYKDSLISYICQTYHSQPRHLRDLKPAGKTSWLSKSKGCEKKVLNIHKRVQAKKVYRLQSKNTQRTVYPDVSAACHQRHSSEKKLFIFFNLTRAGKYMTYYQSFEALRRNFFVSLQKNKKKKNKPRLPDPTSTLTLGKDNNLT